VCNENVVQVDHNVSGKDEVLENIVHHRLERSRGVGKAKVHHQRLKEPPVRTECGLSFVTFPDLDVIETPPDVEFREELGSLQTVNKIVDQRETPSATWTDGCGRCSTPPQ
jgi:hypothetical protein